MGFQCCNNPLVSLICWPCSLSESSISFCKNEKLRMSKCFMKESFHSEVISKPHKLPKWHLDMGMQYILRSMHMVCTLLWFGTGPFSHILQDYFTVTYLPPLPYTTCHFTIFLIQRIQAILWLPQCHPEDYGLINYNYLNLRLLCRDWSLPSYQHNWTVWNPRCIARYCYANQTVSLLKIQWSVQFVLARAYSWKNTGIAEVTQLLNEAHAESPHHKSLWSQSMPRLICMVRHTNNTFSWTQKMLRYSWQDMLNCKNYILSQYIWSTSMCLGSYQH